MELSTDKRESVTVVKIQGRLDTISAPELEQEMTALMGQGDSSFIVDMARMEYISSAGLRSILLVAKKLKPLGGKMVFCSMTPMVAKVFSVSNFSSLFAIHDSLETALAAP
jgi:anti-anti-sigma factor